ncbi:hypothetical protein R3P38DRAFT_2858090, partial [Favolaschia claudopus]
RKATRPPPSEPPATKVHAVSNGSSPGDVPARKRKVGNLNLPHIPGVTGNALPTPPNSEGIFPTYYPLLRLGCVELPSGMIQCNIHDEGKPEPCEHQAGLWGDMGRHVETHFRGQGKELTCEGCPLTFSRGDAQKRHVGKRKPEHFSPERKKFVLRFNKMKEVLQMKAHRKRTDGSWEALNKQLYGALFEELLAEN